jgi:hypothetical protein
VNIWKEQMQNQHYVSALIKQTGLELNPGQ